MTSVRNTKRANFKEDNISSKLVECAVVGCSNKTPRDSERWISFHRLPLKIARFVLRRDVMLGAQAFNMASKMADVLIVLVRSFLLLQSG